MNVTVVQFEQLRRQLVAEGTPENVIERLKPWAAMMKVTFVAPEGAETSLDERLFRLASARRMRVMSLESIAEQMLRENLTNRSIVARYAQIKRYVEEWEADALIIHSIKSCRLFSAGQGDMREYFTRDLGVPTLLVESDLEDPRYYAEAQIKNRIDAFFESLEHRKLVQSA